MRSTLWRKPIWPALNTMAVNYCSQCCCRYYYIYHYRHYLHYRGPRGKTRGKKLQFLKIKFDFFFFTENSHEFRLGMIIMIIYFFQSNELVSWRWQFICQSKPVPSFLVNFRSIFPREPSNFWTPHRREVTWLHQWQKEKGPPNYKGRKMWACTVKDVSEDERDNDAGVRVAANIHLVWSVLRVVKHPLLHFQIRITHISVIETE